MVPLSEALAIAFAHHQAGRLALAEEIYRRVLEQEPEQADALHLLGVAAIQRGDPARAIDCISQAIGLRPTEAQYHNNLGEAYHGVGRLEEAIACYRRAIELAPKVSAFLGNLGNVLYRVAEPEEAVECYRRAMELDPHESSLHSDYLCALRYLPDITPVRLRDALADYQRRHAAPLEAGWLRHANSREPERRLRLGFVAPAFVRFPLAPFLLPALEHLDRRECEVVCYAGADRVDSFTPRFQAAADRWRITDRLSDEQFAQQIRADEIDILFDLVGHTPRNRLLVLARKPAPIQITWLDSVGTTGLTAIDYVLADRYTVPPGTEAHYAEKVLRMPDGYVAFDPPSDAPPVGPLPAMEQGRVTFACFNNPAKIHRRVVELWSRILKQAPGSRILLQYDGFQLPVVRRRFEQQFGQFGVSPDRLVMQGHSSCAEYLAEYRNADIALDPFPHNGGLTTCDALWMGVPVVTWPGETFAARQSFSYLSNLGLTETIAADFEDYVNRAVGLARDLPRLAAIRANLRDRFAQSPLCDGPRFAASLAELLRGIWREWCLAE